MKLETYLIAQQLSPAEFARQLGVRSRTTIHRYLSGERQPSPQILHRIETVTLGQVTAEDFAANDNDEGEERMPPPWAKKTSSINTLGEQAFLSMVREWDAAQTLSPPVQKAIDVLGARVSVDASQSHFKLDGRPSDLRLIISAANAILTLRQEPLVHYPMVNPIHD